MKKLLPLVSALMLAAPGFGGSGLLFAQETAPSAAPANEANRNIELIPAEIPPFSRAEAGGRRAEPAQEPAKVKRAEPPRQPAVEKKNKTEAAADEMQGRLRLRQAKTRALGDSAVQAQWERAHAARTDPAKREAMRSYYRLLYARMEKLDASIKGRITLQRDALLRSLDQRNASSSDVPVDLGEN